MAWTQAELDALKAAYAAGTVVVHFDGRRVEYDNEAGLLRRIQTIEAAIAAASGRRRPGIGLIRYTRG